MKALLEAQRTLCQPLRIGNGYYQGKLGSISSFLTMGAQHTLQSNPSTHLQHYVWPLGLACKKH